MTFFQHDSSKSRQRFGCTELTCQYNLGHQGCLDDKGTGIGTKTTELACQHDLRLLDDKGTYRRVKSEVERSELSGGVETVNRNVENCEPRSDRRKEIRRTEDFENSVKA